MTSLRKPHSEVVCWTRMQAEAGEEFSRIAYRKELERRAGDGLFFWGVGNAPSRAIPALATLGRPVKVVFSLMKSRPRTVDVRPDRVLAWTRFIDMHGRPHAIPEHVLVTSRACARGHHYALVCRSDEPLLVRDHGPFDPSAFRNFGGLGKPVGASQVTALLERVAPSGCSDYRISMRASLAGSYWVKLVDPVEVTSDKREILGDVQPNCGSWIQMALNVRSGPVTTRSIEAKDMFTV